MRLGIRKHFDAEIEKKSNIYVPVCLYKYQFIETGQQRQNWISKDDRLGKSHTLCNKAAPMKTLEQM